MRVATVVYTHNITKQYLITNNYELRAFILATINEAYEWYGIVLKVLTCYVE